MLFITCFKSLFMSVCDLSSDMTYAMDTNKNQTGVPSRAVLPYLMKLYKVT